MMRTEKRQLSMTGPPRRVERPLESRCGPRRTGQAGPRMSLSGLNGLRGCAATAFMLAHASNNDGNLENCLWFILPEGTNVVLRPANSPARMGHQHITACAWHAMEGLDERSRAAYRRC